LAENRTEWIIVQMAVALVGATFVPLNSHYTKDDLAWVLEQSQAKIIFCSQSFRSHNYLVMCQAIKDQISGLKQVVAFESEEWRKLSACVLPEENSSSVTLDQPAMLLFTSGTTGFPKGALLSHRAVMWDSLAGAERLRTTATDKMTSIIPLFHCAGCVMSVLGCLQTGAAYIGVPSFDPVGMFRVIQGEKCTMLSGVPTSFLAMHEHSARNDFDLSSLRAGTCGGADVDPEVLRSCAEEWPMPGLCQVYGQTEVATLSTCPDVDDPKRFITAGPALRGLEVRITDAETDVPVEQGQIGQIETRGPTNMDCYDRNPAATAETIQEGWLKSGDLGYLDKDGYLVISGGRLKDMIIRGGENIYPVEIENVLREHPSIEEIAVVAEKDEFYGEVVSAVIKSNGAATEAAKSSYCVGKIARFKIPTKIYQIDAFPMTASRKIQKNKLRDMIAASQLTRIDQS
jgi:fatty-acyl-CoA synthase